MSDNRNLGPTGQFPNGKVNEHDQGELRIAIGQNEHGVTIEFGVPVAWVVMDREHALQIAKVIRERAMTVPSASVSPPESAPPISPTPAPAGEHGPPVALRGHLKGVTMRPPRDVQRAHDILKAIFMGEVAIEINDDGERMGQIHAALDVLCWVLNHDHNQAFARNLARAEATLTRRGYILKEVQ